MSMADQIRILARRLHNLERDVRNLGTQPQLAYSSIEDGALQAYIEGQQTMIVGQQYDGTSSTTVITGPPPPAPTKPEVMATVAGLKVTWKGTFIGDAVAPMDFARVTIHAVPQSQYSGPTPDGKIVGSWADALGGTLVAPLPYETHVVYLIAWSEAGKFSEGSETNVGLPLKIDASDLAEEIGDALEQAVSDSGEAISLTNEWRVTGKTTIDGGKVEADTIKAGQVASDAILTRHLKSLQITSDKIAVNAITADMLTSNNAVINALQGQTITAITLEGATLKIPEALYVEPGQATFIGEIRATSATFQDNISILGQKNFLQGRLAAANGVNAPSGTPTVSFTWASQQIDTSFQSFRVGLTDNDASDSWVMATQVVNNTYRSGIWVRPKTLGSAATIIALEDDGFTPYGITRIGSWYYIIGQNSTTNSNGAWAIRRYNMSGIRSGGSLVDTDPNAFRRKPSIGTDGTDLFIAYANGDGMYVRRHGVDSSNVNNNTVISTTKMTYSGAATDVGGIAVTVADIGGSSANRFWIAPGDGSVQVFTTNGTAETTRNFQRANSVKLKGLFWNGTRFLSTDESGNLNSYALHGPVANQSYSYAYTWYDSNDAGGGIAETTRSQIYNVAVPARSRPTISIPPAPYDGTTDGANTAHVYACPSGGTLSRQTPADGLPVGTTVIAFDTITSTGTAPPTTNGFAASGRTNAVVGSVESTVGLSDRPSWYFRGDGTNHIRDSYQRLACTTNLTLSTTDTAVAGLSATVTSTTTSDVFEVTAFLDINVSTAGAAVGIGTLQVDGTAQAGLVTYQASAVTRGTVGQSWRVTGLSPGNHTIRMMGSKTASTAAIAIQSAHSTLSIKSY